MKHSAINNTGIAGVHWDHPGQTSTYLHPLIPLKALGSFLTYFVPAPIPRQDRLTLKLSRQIYQNSLNSLYPRNDRMLTESNLKRVKTDISPLQTHGILLQVILSDILEMFPLNYCRFQRPTVAFPKSSSPRIQPPYNKMEVTCL